VLPKSASAPPPLITLRVTVRAHDLESFVTRYSRHIDGDRIFIFTKNPQPVATRIRFTLQLESGEQLLHGKGTVTRVQDGGDPRHPAGMELVFVALDDRSQTLVDFMLASREAELPAIARAVEPPAPPRPPPPEEPEPPAEAQPPPEGPREETISRKLRATVPPLPERPVAPGPSPNVAEKWRDPLPPGAPAAGTDHTVSANPFTEVPDSAIDYFVEWSFEQSIGPRAQEKSTFSDVAMALPTPSSDPAPAPLETPRSDRRLVLIAAAAFVAGGVGGVGGTLLLHPLHPLPPAVAVVAPRPEPVVAPSPAAAAPAAPKEDPPTTITSHPPGALAVVDGKALGPTPVTAHLLPGKHDLTLTKERYQATKSTLEAPSDLSLTLKRPLAMLHVVSKPPGADVKIDGVAHGKTPVALKLPAYEKYDVELSQGARRWRRSVYLKESPNELRATLAAAAAPAPPVSKR
jgi:PEGA domain